MNTPPLVENPGLSEFISQVMGDSDIRQLAMDHLGHEIASLRNALHLAESAAAAALDERDVLARWKKEALVHMRKWDAVDEAREQLESILSVIPSDAPCLYAETGETVADYILGLQKEVGRVHALYFNTSQQLEDMREAIGVASRVIENARFVHQAITTYTPQDEVDRIENQKHCVSMTTALAKLQPFLKP